MIVVIAVAALVVIGLAVALAFGGLSRLSVHRSDPVAADAGTPLPDGDFTSDDIGDLRFGVVLRGYRMDQVDAAIDRLHARIAHLEDAVGDQRGPRTDASFDAGSIAMFPPVGGGPHARGPRHPVGEPWDGGTRPEGEPRS